MRQKGQTLRGATCASLVLLVTLTATPSPAQQEDSDAPRRAFSLPIEVDFDFGAANGNAIINRYLPLVAVPVNEDWSLVNLTLAAIADAPGGITGQPGNPEPVAGGRVFGLTDLTDVVLFSRTRSEEFIWGIGPTLTLPTATDDRLGSGKWLLGPALRVVYRPGQWNLGAIALNHWSVGGDSDRADVNQLLIRGTIRRELPSNWYFVYAPIITANWNASSGEKWLVPLGGGFGRTFKLGPWKVALSVQAYGNVLRPDGAPDGLVRVGLVVPIPAPFR